LSRLGPGTKLNPHCGWGGHSNHVIRCHFGFKVPNGYYVSVKDDQNIDNDEEIKFHKEREWLMFDDSRIHYVHNPTEYERIVLIVNVKHPKRIKTGDSVMGDTKELLQIVNLFQTTKYQNKQK
jgi:aspartyl/asparaginyl beta-hydroxylase (cupin superfamily)